MKRANLLFLLTASLVLMVHLATDPVSEPFFYNDETRHVMTGVFIRDALMDLPTSATDPAGYAVRYYGQYPALGLLTWPPLFYLLEGLAMVAFGTSFLVGRSVIGLFTLLAGWYAYRLVCRTHPTWTGLLVVLLIGFSPVVYEHSRRVMLELPTLALVLAAIFHFERYLSELRPRDAVQACLFAALAALMRYDAVVLLPFFLIRLVSTRNLGLLIRRPVVFGLMLALMLTLPYYWLTWNLYAAGLSKTALEGASTGGPAVLTLDHMLYYPRTLPVQVGWFMTAAAIAGAVVAFAQPNRPTGWAAALWMATYALFTPLAELDSRHVIYWVPAVALFSAEAIRWLVCRNTPVGVLAATLLVVGTAGDAITRPAWWLQGYETAARYVVDQTTGERPVLMDGLLNGSFIYHTRQADSARRLWILRGDKLLYSMFSDPNMACTEHVQTEADVLALLHNYDPELIIVEQPQLVYRIRAADLLRETLKTYPDRFRLEFTTPIHSNHHNHFAGARLEIYRKLDRNPNPVRTVELPVFGLGQTLQATRSEP
jgi:hypothetical protein